MTRLTSRPAGRLPPRCFFLSLTCLMAGFSSCSKKTPPAPAPPALETFVLDDDTAVDPSLQAQLEAIDARLRGELGLSPEHTAAGILDLRTGRLAWIHPDRFVYAASVAKIGILLAYFHEHPDAPASLAPDVRHDLGLMAKASSNGTASRFSREIGLRRIQEILNAQGFYDQARGGGLWLGKHYGKGEERYGDPVHDHSAGATVRQVMRYFLMLEQGRLLSPEASRAMRQIFESPDIPPDDIKFVRGLAGREVQIIRKWGSWEDWLHDAAVITGAGRHYILVALTHHPSGDAYLAALAPALDDVLAEPVK